MKKIYLKVEAINIGGYRGDYNMGYLDLGFDSDSIFLVTGGAGFIGSNLCEAILKLGYKVRCLDNLSTGKMSNINEFFSYEGFEFIEGDITNIDVCLYACKGVDFVLHQAAWGSVPRSIEMPINYNLNNISGTLNMMEAARISIVKKFVYASSSSVYGDSPVLPQKEGEEGHLLSPYALTKKTDEEYGKLYKSLYGIDTYGLRYFNVFGKRQNVEGSYAAVIPLFIKTLMEGKPPVIHGDGMQSRDFTFIENVIEANLKACKACSSVAGSVFNIAYGSKTSLIDVYYKIAEELNIKIEPILGPSRVGDIKHSNADIGLARQALGYNPSFSFEDGLKHAIEWYKASLNYPGSSLHAN